MDQFDNLLKEVRACEICINQLPLGCNPIVQAGEHSKIVIIGQAPGLKVNETGIPFDDKSGDELRLWLGVTKEQFYDVNNFAIMPMGFCYPGKGKNGDLPPMKICAPTWHHKILSEMKEVKLILLVGQYSQKYYLNSKATLTTNVHEFHTCLPTYFPLPHPSPRNFIWMNKNKWFNIEVLPVLKHQIAQILNFN
ncbi:uracil-DNA glycosylase family protein [Myroides injenensis]|uniref:uracil-DNA glycosylase family protein n=1 Tax=Myroides injenensis TaxID=1183151 RepID=UPI000289F7FC|nr:uracil-DNA glycosylase family protein [Myroides injenensis]